MKIFCFKEKCFDDRVEVVRLNKIRLDVLLKRVLCFKVWLMFLGIVIVVDSDLMVIVLVGVMIVFNMKVSGKEKVFVIVKCKLVFIISIEKIIKVIVIDSVCLRLCDSLCGEVFCLLLKSRGVMINKRKVLGFSLKVWD